MDLGQLVKIFFPKSDFSKLCFQRQLVASDVAGCAINGEELLAWPPNLFIILFNWLEYTDKYRRIVSPEDNSEWTDQHLIEATEIRDEWIVLLKVVCDQLTSSGVSGPQKAPFLGPKTKRRLNIVFSPINFNECLYDLSQRGQVLDSIFILMSAIDMIFETFDWACENPTDHDSALRMLALLKADNRVRNLAKNDATHQRQDAEEEQVVSSLSDNHTKNGFVTLKTCVPQSGLTINNLMQHLCFLKPSVKPKVIFSGAKKSDTKEYRILVLPWPFEVKATDFSSASSKLKIHRRENFGFFDYAPSERIDIKRYLTTLISTVERYGYIDLVVFPECSLSETEFEKVKKVTFDSFGERAPCILAGVHGSKEAQGINKAALAFIDDAGQFAHAVQHKHHRWYLDRQQLKNYHLSGVLNPQKKLWENIEVNRRNLLMLHTSDNVKLCPLICEDLARQEPVAQAVRSTGSNLVVALLLDGPQLLNRWPGKYAAVLSDDPGSSVLTVTPLGMTQRSTGTGFKPSRVVALWSDQVNSDAELEIAEGGAGLLIETNISYQDMWSIDGRCVKKPILVRKNTDTIYTQCDTLKNVSGLSEKQLVNVLKDFTTKQEAS
ncbi:TPA: hypothetical protein RQK93_002533 [Vibrio vulnificus]|nr:hypothetical protein [Vibrio vulnificus]HEQ3612614.1 hypothetical protein [Vibrio cholerae]